MFLLGLTTPGFLTLCKNSTIISFSWTPTPLKCLRTTLVRSSLVWRRNCACRAIVGDRRPTWDCDRTQWRYEEEKAVGVLSRYSRRYSCKTSRSKVDHWSPGVIVGCAADVAVVVMPLAEVTSFNCEPVELATRCNLPFDLWLSLGP